MSAEEKLKILEEFVERIDDAEKFICDVISHPYVSVLKQTNDYEFKNEDAIEAGLRDVWLGAYKLKVKLLKEIKNNPIKEETTVA